MSKIFDALSKAQGEVASLALPLIKGAGAAGPQADRNVNVDVPQSFLSARCAETGT